MPYRDVLSVFGKPTAFRIGHSALPPLPATLPDDN